MPVRTAYVGLEVRLNVKEGKRWVTGKGTILRISTPRGTKVLVDCDDGPKWVSLNHLWHWHDGWPLTVSDPIRSYN